MSKQSSILPEYWFIKVTEENRPYLSEWRLKYAVNYVDPTCMGVGEYLLSYHPDGSYYYGSRNSPLEDDKFKNYTEIDFDTFQEAFNIKLNYVIISRKKFIEGYELACSTWKEKLLDKYAKQLAIYDKINVEIYFLNELMRHASSSLQKEFISKILDEHNTINLTQLEVGEKLICNTSKQEYMRLQNGYINLTTNCIVNDGVKNINGIKKETTK